MEKFPITKAGFEKLKKDLETLKKVDVLQNVKEIETARAHGDISENAEYAAAKERQAFIQGRLQELENNLAHCRVIDVKVLSNEKVVFGTTVRISDMESGEEISYRLVGPFESDISLNRISVTSPIGRALIGKKVGDEAKVNAPGGQRYFEIIDISIED